MEGGDWLFLAPFKAGTACFTPSKFGWICCRELLIVLVPSSICIGRDAFSAELGFVLIGFVDMWSTKPRLCPLGDIGGFTVMLLLVTV